MAVAEVLAAANEFRPDLIVHAGDLFDVPHAAAIDIQWTLDRLKDLSAVAPVLVIAGNHDSPLLFRVWNELIRLEHPDSRTQRVQFVPYARLPADGGIHEYEFKLGERVKIAVVPWIKPTRIVDFFSKPDERMLGYRDQISLILEALNEGLQTGYDARRDILMLTAHLHVEGVSVGTSEKRLYVSDTYATRPDDAPIVTYCAYGHIHKPQSLPGLRTGWYAGSVIPIDFGEMLETKRVMLVEAAPGRPPEIEARPLSGGRRLVRLDGTLAEVGDQGANVGDAICQITIRTEVEIPDLSKQIQLLMPDATIVEIFTASSTATTKVLSEDDATVGKEPSFGELFEDYLTSTKLRGGSRQRILDLFQRGLNAVENDDQFDDNELAALEDALSQTKT